MDAKVFVASGPMEMQGKINKYLDDYKHENGKHGLKAVEVSASYQVVKSGMRNEYHALIVLRSGL